ncbi:MAG: hemolysin family protein [Thermodesulfobacteriota bacterium]
MRFSLKKIQTISALILSLTIVGSSLASSGENSNSPFSADAMMLIVYVSMALFLSFLCSISEAVLLSVTPSYIEIMKESRPKRAALLKRLRQDNVDQSLAAILTLNTIANTAGAVGAGAKATIVFGSVWLGLFSAIMTLMILFVSEIIPKTIGAIYWSKLAGPVAAFLNMLIKILYPIVWISEKITGVIARGKDVHVFSRDEFVAMARVGEQTGHLQSKESRIIRNLFRFEGLSVTDIMTPRTVISALPEDMRIMEALKQVTQTPFSRLPIYGKGLDDMTGFVLKDDVLIFSTQKRCEEKLSSIKRKFFAVPESVSLSALLERFLKDRQHIAIVINEYGGTIGLVTLEDLVETLIGMEIMDETDKVEDMQALARKQWAERAAALGIGPDLVK